jgi:hypothetical protein
MLTSIRGELDIETDVLQIEKQTIKVSQEHRIGWQSCKGGRTLVSLKRETSETRFSIGVSPPSVPDKYAIC